MEKFNIKELVEKEKHIATPEEHQTHSSDSFEVLVKIVEKSLDKIDNEEIGEIHTLERRRRAILGVNADVDYYKVKIREIVAAKDLRRQQFPPWYKTLEDALYNEILGFYGINQWLNDEKYEHSDACMVIAENIYFDENGEPVLQPQTISREKRDRLKETLMLTNPKEPRAAAKHELYSNQKRVTVFNDNGVAKEGRDTIIFRKYHINKFTFEEQAERGTIPWEAINMFKNMVKIGYSVCFVGPVKSAKTTMLTTWQSYENPKLTGLSIETDPEIPFHELPQLSTDPSNTSGRTAPPIIQFVPDEDNMDSVLERAKRSDCKYIVIGEARNGKMLNLALEAAYMGGRLKASYHIVRCEEFCYSVGESVTRDCGGGLLANMIKTAKTFQYVFNLWPLPGEGNKKRLKGIWEVRFDRGNMQIIMNQICRYIQETDSWVWSYDIGEYQREIGMENSAEDFKSMEKTLKELAEKYPDPKEHLHVDPYMKILLAGGKL